MRKWVFSIQLVDFVKQMSHMNATHADVCDDSYNVKDNEHLNEMIAVIDRDIVMNLL